MPGQGNTATTIPTQIGPLNVNPIKFNGIGVSGQFQLTLASNGGWNFSGVFYDPDALDYSDGLAVVVVDSKGVEYQFTHSGSMNGWIDRWYEGGSNTDSWGNSGVNGELAAGWQNLFNASGDPEFSWWWNASINADIGDLLKEIEGIANAVQTISKIVAVFAS